MYEEKFMQRAIAISRRALTEPGTEPFGAVIVRDGEIIGEGLNHSLANFDPTSHGEVEAIRDACRRLQCVDLAGADLYTSCEPCALCVSTMKIAGIGKLYFAASIGQAGQALDDLSASLRHPIDPDEIRGEAGATSFERVTPAEQYMDVEAADVIAQWARFISRQK